MPEITFIVQNLADILIEFSAHYHVKRSTKFGIGAHKFDTLQYDRYIKHNAYHKNIVTLGKEAFICVVTK